jgi:hypothetical protein
MPRRPAQLVIKRPALSWRLWALVAVLPGLVLGPAFSGLTAWIHVHGPEGEHLHLLAEHIASEHRGALHDWHHAQHQQVHDDGQGSFEHPQDAPRPRLLLSDIPPAVAAPSTGQVCVSAFHPSQTTHVPAPPWCVETRGLAQLHAQPLGWRPPLQWRATGTEALLRSNHAILI